MGMYIGLKDVLLKYPLVFLMACIGFVFGHVLEIPSSLQMRDLLNVLNSVEFSNPSESAEDVLIYNNANNHPSISVHEIGLGAILLKPPTSPADIRASGQGS
ncbi:unnamed protein product [Prunus armeniaca]